MALVLLGAIVATIFVYITLILLKKVERVFVRDVGTIAIDLELRNKPGQIAKVTDVMGRLNIQIKDIQIIHNEDEDDDIWTRIKFFIRLPAGMNKNVLLAELKQLDGVITEMEEG